MSRRLIHRRLEALEARHQPRKDDRWEQLFKRLNVAELEALEALIIRHRSALDAGRICADEFVNDLPEELAAKVRRCWEIGELPEPSPPTPPLFGTTDPQEVTDERQ